MSMSLELMCPSMGGHEQAVISWRDTMCSPWDIKVMSETEGDWAGFLAKCRKFHNECEADIEGIIHSDLFILEHGWDIRVLLEFRDPQVAVVGFVGATRLGHPDIYKVPYDYKQLARDNVWSNLTDWEVHGGQETGSRRVAVIDSCAVFVRRSLLLRLGGWPVGRYPNSSHCSDLWLCSSVQRLGLHSRIVGVACQHAGGGKGEAGSGWLEARGGDEKLHRQAHQLIYEDFRDLLPIEVK